NVYPSEVDAVVCQLTGYGGEHRILITRDGPMDELLIQVEATAELHAQGTASLLALRDTASHRLQRMLGLRAKVEGVAPGTFPRTDFKARRVIDNRDVFRAMNQRLTQVADE